MRDKKSTSFPRCSPSMGMPPFVGGGTGWHGYISTGWRNCQGLFAFVFPYQRLFFFNLPPLDNKTACATVPNCQCRRRADPFISFRPRRAEPSGWRSLPQRGRAGGRGEPFFFAFALALLYFAFCLAARETRKKRRRLRRRSPPPAGGGLRLPHPQMGELSVSSSA